MKNSTNNTRGRKFSDSIIRDLLSSHKNTPTVNIVDFILPSHLFNIWYLNISLNTIYINILNVKFINPYSE